MKNGTVRNTTAILALLCSVGLAFATSYTFPGGGDPDTVTNGSNCTSAHAKADCLTCCTAFYTPLTDNHNFCKAACDSVPRYSVPPDEN